MRDETSSPLARTDARVRIYTLGRFLVEVDSAPLRFGHKVQRKPLSLLKLLAAQGGQAVSVEQLCESLWPDAEGDQAHGALSSTLYRLRKLIGADALTLAGGRLTLEAGQCWVDCWAFARRLEEAALAAEHRQHDAAWEHLETALAVYQGPFLDGEFDLPEILAAREKLHALFLRHIARLGRHYGEAGQHPRAILLYQKGLEIDDLAEELCQGLMRCYQAQGRLAEGVTIYHRLCEVLRARIGIQPAPETQAIYRALITDPDGAGPAPEPTPPPKAPFQAPGTPAESAPAPAPEGERRQATVAFLNLSGYTALSEALDPEEAEELLGRIRAAAEAVVERHGGTVNQFVRDEVVAVFGIPAAHADDPVRAVRAALELHEAVRRIGPEVEGRIGLPLRLHTAINTGLVIVQGRDERAGRYGISGDTVSVGARLVARAKADQIVVGPETQRLIAPHFETEASEPVVLQGKTTPVTPYRVIRETHVPQGPRQPLVGRRAELRQFTGAIETCLEAGAGQTIYVRGDAGIGKSRLVEAFQAIAVKRGFACHMGLVLDFGMGQGRDAIQELVSSFLQIAPGGDEGLRGNAAKNALSAGLVGSDQEVFLNDLLDLPQPKPLRAFYEAMEHETRNRGQREMVAQLVKRLSGRQPQLLLVEDIQWADEMTLAFLARLASVVAETPALLVMTARVAGDPLAREWRGALGGCPLITIDLAPLRREEALELAGTFFDVTSRIAMSCVERAAGHPLFLEQLLRSAEETAEEAVPGSLQSIVLARFDKLQAHDRQALRAASVLGQRFSLDTLRQLSEDQTYTCRGLIEHNLVRPEGEDYLFSHSLIQEVVYNSLLKSRARALHRRAADLFAGRDPLVRAEHFDRAEDTAAPLAYLEAAEAQAAEFHYERALHLVERGMELTGDQAQQFALTCFAGQILHDLGSIPASIESYQKALASAADEVQRCQAWIGLAAGMRIVDKYDEALEALDEAEGAATTHGLGLELARLHHLRGNIYFPLGNLEGCLQQHELALKHARQIGSHEYEARALGGLGDAHYVQGRMVTAHAYFRRCVELSREHGYGRVEVANLYMVAATGLYLNDLHGALQDSLTAAEATRQLGQKRAEMVARLPLCRMLIELNDMTTVETHINHGLELADSLGASRFKPFFMINLARVRLAQKGHDPATVRLVEEALEISRETGARFLAPWVLSTLALVNDDPALSRRALKEGEEILNSGCVGHNYYWFYRDAIEVALNNGDWEEAERYASALEAYTRPEPAPWSDYFIARGRALAAHGGGRRDDALLEELKGLREEAARVGLKLALPALEQALTAK